MSRRPRWTQDLLCLSPNIDDYLDKFVELVVEAGYTDSKTTVVKFQKGLDPQIQNTIAMMAYGHPSNASPEAWYEAAKNVNQNCAANEAFKLAYWASSLPYFSSGLSGYTERIPSSAGCTHSSNSS